MHVRLQEHKWFSRFSRIICYFSILISVFCCKCFYFSCLYSSLFFTCIYLTFVHINKNIRQYILTFFSILRLRLFFNMVLEVYFFLLSCHTSLVLSSLQPWVATVIYLLMLKVFYTYIQMKILLWLFISFPWFYELSFLEQIYDHYFECQNKVEFINGSAPQPSQSDQTYGVWIRCNNMVVSWLILSVSSSIR